MADKFYCRNCKYFKPYHYFNGEKSSSYFCDCPNGYFQNCDRTETDYCYNGEMSDKKKKLLRVMISEICK